MQGWLDLGNERQAPPVVPQPLAEPAVKAATDLRDEERVHSERFEAVVAQQFGYPAARFGERGIVVCGGGYKYFPCVWVCVKMLRHLGCMLPIAVWHLGPMEMTQAMSKLIEPLGVSCVDAHTVREEHPVRHLQGWELKAYALLHCRFHEVLLLDADNVPVLEPSYLFDESRTGGAVFWRI